MTQKEFLTTVREKYPDYKDVSDEDLSSGLYAKYPEYREFLTPPRESSESQRLPALSPTEQLLGGELLDPTTGERSPQQVQEALQKVVIPQKERAQAEIDRLGQGSSKAESLTAGAGTVAMGLGDLLKLGMQKSGMSESDLSQAFPMDERLKEELNRQTGDNPLTAALGSGVANALTQGRGGGSIVNLARAGGLARDEATRALAAELAKRAAVEMGTGAGTNVAVGEGLRRLTGGETTGQDLLTDTLLGALTSGKIGQAPQAPARTLEETFESMIPKVQERQRMDEILRRRASGELPNLTPEDVQASRGSIGQVPPVLEVPQSANQAPPVIQQPPQPKSVQKLGLVGRTVEKARINQAQKAAKDKMVQDIAERSSEGAKTTVGKSNIFNSIKNAADNGIEVEDLEIGESLSPREKRIYSEMVDDAEAYNSNRVKNASRDPRLRVGNEVVDRIERSIDIVDRYGKQLGQYVKDLPSNRIPNTQKFVLESLQQTNGLEGISVNSKGKLDFSNTTISTDKGAQREIQNLFNDVKKRSPFQNHLLRRELFEQLGGKKSAGGIPITGTYEAGINAIREGLSNALDSVSDEYKALNLQYAEALTPLKEMQKFLKIKGDVADDILREKSAIIARRLTSHSPTGSDFKGTLRKMEDQIVKSGDTVETNVTNLQEMYNVLNKYFPNLSGGTSAQKVMGSKSSEVAESLKGMAIQKGKSLISESEAVRQKFLKDYIKALDAGQSPF